MFAVDDVYAETPMSEVEPEPPPNDGDETRRIDHIPMSFATARTLQNHDLTEPLMVLFDPGSTNSWLNVSKVPKGVNGQLVEEVTGNTMAGSFTSKLAVTLKDVCFPEFHHDRLIDSLQARVFHSPCRYDLIVGRLDLKYLMGMKIDFDELIMTWDDAVVSMKTNSTPKAGEPSQLEQMMIDVLEEELNDGFVNDILPATYEAHDVSKVAQAQHHLEPEQRNDLEAIFLEHTKLFDGRLKEYTGDPVHLHIDPSATPHRSRAYPVAKTHEGLFKNELDRLVDEDVLEKAERSEWIAGTFIIKKKDDKVRFVSDFRALNAAIRRRVYPIPLIHDLIRRRKGYKYLSKLDISMQYYTFVLDESSRNYTTIATPWGLYRYKRLPMGICESPDIAQEIMEQVLESVMDEIEVYIDDIAAFSDSWDDHCILLSKVLTLLQDTGFTINPLKCEWGVKETDFLGYWLTPDGIKPWAKKISAIVAMKEPTTLKQLRSTLGMVGYYREMWPKMSHTLAPLSALTGCKTFQWSSACSQAFKALKAVVTTDAMLAYPDHNLPFDIETDSSDYQLGAVIKQQGRPVAYYSRKLNPAQQNYTTIEKELLSIVETLRKYRTMLLGARINVHTDHKNLTHRLTAFQTQRVMRWRLLLEEFDCTYYYKDGPSNVLADAISRLPRGNASVWERPKGHPTADEPNGSQCAEPVGSHADADAGPSGPPAIEGVTYTPAIESDQLDEEDTFFSCIAGLDECPALVDCLMEYPVFDEQAKARHPFQFETIQWYQQQCNDTKQLLQLQPAIYKMQQFGDSQLICQMEKPAEPKIVLSNYMMPLLVKYYHESSAHAEGADRLTATICRHFHHPGLRQEIKNQIGPCKLCQQYKRHGGSYGELAPREALAIPWQEVHVDTIGPWRINKRGLNLKIRAMTMMDPVTNLLEIRQIPRKNGTQCALAFDHGWLSRYPKPVRVLHDAGPEFKIDWTNFLARAGILSKPISKGNPQSNGIVEQVHKTVGLVLRILVNRSQYTTKAELEALVEDAIHTAMRATRAASHHSLDNISPGALAFRRDMNLDIPLMTDVLALQDLRQRQIDHRLLRANAKRRSHDYKVGDKVLVKRLLSHSAPNGTYLQWSFHHSTSPYQFNCLHPHSQPSTSSLQHPPDYSLSIAGGSSLVWESASVEALPARQRCRPARQYDLIFGREHIQINISDLVQWTNLRTS